MTKAPVAGVGFVGIKDIGVELVQCVIFPRQKSHVLVDSIQDRLQTRIAKFSCC